MATTTMFSTSPFAWRPIVRLPAADRLLVRDLAEALLRDYSINRKKSFKDLKIRWERHLRPFFGELEAALVSMDQVTLYIAQRQKEGAADATINRETAVLKRMYTLALRARKLSQRPYIPTLKESNVRQGFVRDAQYKALARETAKIGLWLRGLFEMGYTYGLRKTELLELRVRQVDFTERTIVLDPGETKNGEGRLLPMTGKVLELLSECMAGKAGDDYVFTREHDHLGRRPRTRWIWDYRKGWNDACQAAGCPGLLFHDLRRSAVRNLVRSGVSEKCAMRISGHKTRSIFDRYHIIDQSDLDRAIRMLEALRPGEALIRP